MTSKSNETQNKAEATSPSGANTGNTTILAPSLIGSVRRLIMCDNDIGNVSSSAAPCLTSAVVQFIEDLVNNAKGTAIKHSNSTKLDVGHM